MNKQHKVFKALYIIIVASGIFFLTHPVFCMAKESYYLQVASFRSEYNAARFAEKLRSCEASTVVQGAQVSGIGYWYRVHVGPFPSWQEADSQRMILRKKGLFLEDAFIHKKENLLETSLAGSLPEHNRIAEVGEADKTFPTEDQSLPPIKQDRTIKPEPSAPDPLFSEAVESTGNEEAGSDSFSQQDPAGPPTFVAQTPAAPIESVPASKPEPTDFSLRKGSGRNLARGCFSLGVNHTYLEMPTEITKRDLISLSGGVPTLTNVSLGSFNKEGFETTMHTDTLRIRYGLTDFLEVSAALGLAYDSSSGLDRVYGCGARFNLYEKRNGRFDGFYIALQEDYRRGQLETDYKADAGNWWKTDADWYEWTSRLETGMVYSRFATYAGGSYSLYREDTSRRMVGVPIYKYQDEIEEENGTGLFGGADYSLTPAVLLNLEGRIINKKSISGSLEYRF